MRKEWVLLVAIPVVFSACAGSHSSGKAPYGRHYRVDRHATPKSDIPLVVNDRVLAWVDYFSGPGRERFGRYMKRSGRYAPMIRETLRSYGLPQDLIYLAMIESGFASKARSHASAVGVWQFIRATGNRYGLEQDVWIEERQDAEKATHAAAKYLRDLYNEFGDWYLAMAAYNSGEGTVRRGIARTGSKDFWVMSNPRTGVFRAETRDYVPKFIAAAIVAKNPQQFGFNGVQMDAPLQYDRVAVDSHVDIEVIAKCVGTDTETIDILNSELKLGTAPPQFQVKVPAGTAKKFQMALARIPHEERVKTIAITEQHTVGKGETLHKIAKRYGVKASTILSANNLRNGRAVRRGMTLNIPMGDMKSSLLASAGYRKSGGTVAMSGITIISRDDSPKGKSKMASIATESEAATVVDGGTVATGYVVSVGDSWNSISQNLGMSTKALKKLNPSIASAGLHVGDVLRIGTTDQQIAQAPAASNSDASPTAAPVVVTDVPVGSVPSIGAVEKVSVETIEVESPVTKTPKKSTTQRSAQKKAKAKVISYKVKPGDNLWTIGKRHKISHEQIKQISQLKKGHLRPGDVITLRVGS